MLLVEGLAKVYPAVAGRNAAPGTEVVLFRGLSFEVRTGEMVAIVGESGSGKSSLLHLLAALDTPTEGEVWVDGVRLRGMSERQGAAYQQARRAQDEYIKQVAGSAGDSRSAADHIADAKALLDNGTINEAEFNQLKAKALA